MPGYRAGPRARDHAYSPVAQFDQVASGCEAAGPVGGPDRRHAGVRLATGVDDGKRQAPGPQLGLLSLPEAGQQQDDPPGTPGTYVVEPGPVLYPVGQRREGDRQPGLGRGRDRAADDLHRPGALQLRENQVDKGRSAATGRGAALVTPVEQQGLDALAGGGGNVGVPVEHLRNSRDGDPGGLCDLSDRDAVSHALVIITDRPKCFGTLRRGPRGALTGQKFCARMSSLSKDS